MGESRGCFSLWYRLLNNQYSPTVMPPKINAVNPSPPLDYIVAEGAVGSSGKISS